ncbi:MAG TPA: 4Fe-4S binding protein [Terriglobia bacterium]|nr:4Fe-4S binding protein [Terriglobia bacterium]
MIRLFFATFLALTMATTGFAQDSWDFADEGEAAATWADDLKAQASDLVLFGAFATLTLVGFFRKSERLKWITMAVAVVYLGFWRSQLISIVNIFSLTSWNLPVFRYSLAWYFFALFTVVTTILWGRLYCGRVCAFGSLTQLMDKVVPPRLRIDVPRRIERYASPIKYFLLAGTVLYFIVTRDISIYRYVEPFWMFSLNGSTGLWIGVAGLLVATVFIRNLYCRFLCPVGAFLGILSTLTVFRIKRWSECNSCTICEKKCEWGAIRGPKIIASECVRCDDCERLYMDQKKCPHWLILARKKAQAKA